MRRVFSPLPLRRLIGNPMGMSKTSTVKIPSLSLSGFSSSPSSSFYSSPSPFSSSPSSSSSPPLFVVEDLSSTGTRIIRMNSPKTLNAMTVAMGEGFKKLTEDTIYHTNTNDLRSIILTGNGRAFSAGGDLDFLLERCKETPLTNQLIMRKFYAQWLHPLLNISVPTIAAINGPAIGAGACITLACDLRVTHDNADIGFTFSRLGLHAGMGATHTLSILLGHAQANRLLLLGETFKGDKALQYGLVHESLKDSNAVLQRAIDMAKDFSSMPQPGLRAMVKTMRMRLMDGLERALQREADGQMVSYASNEFADEVKRIQLKSEQKKKEREAKEAKEGGKKTAGGKGDYSAF